MTNFPDTESGQRLFHVLNCLRAIGTAEEKPLDRESCSKNLRLMADQLDAGNTIAEVDNVILAHTTCVVQA